jgi:glycosyltransferase involved in cell wall biosynthesis
VETQITKVVETAPLFIDKIILINDASSDRTEAIAKSLAEKDNRVVLLNHTKNMGVGGAIATGYEWARDNACDIAVVMAGDGQMDPADLPALLRPVAKGEADYSKGNRLFTGEAYKKIPKVRFFGNSALSLLTKIASGYWHIADSQSGYTAINRRALHSLDWSKMYKRYGQPNDLLVRLNIENFRVCDVPVAPIYNIGEKSGIRIRRVLFTISWLLLRLFFWRMKEKYIIRNFHPLIFFYALGSVFGLFATLLFLRVFYFWAFIGHIPPINALAAMFASISASQFLLFAMWFDMEENRDLRVRVSEG